MPSIVEVEGRRNSLIGDSKNKKATISRGEQPGRERELSLKKRVHGLKGKGGVVQKKKKACNGLQILNKRVIESLSLKEKLLRVPKGER